MKTTRDPEKARAAKTALSTLLPGESGRKFVTVNGERTLRIEYADGTYTLKDYVLCPKCKTGGYGNTEIQTVTGDWGITGIHTCNTCGHSFDIDYPEGDIPGKADVTQYKKGVSAFCSFLSALGEPDAKGLRKVLVSGLAKEIAGREAVQKIVRAKNRAAGA